MDCNEVFFFTVFGDWHSNGAFAVSALRNEYRKASGPPDIYLHVGDFGVWNDPKIDDNYLNLIEEELTLQDRELWFTDGNHENHPYLFSLPLDSRGLGKLTEHIYYIPRGHHWKFGDKKFLALGGAGSIDFKWRTMGVDWFPEESITEEQYLKAISEGKVDFLLTHEAAEMPDEHHIPMFTLSQAHQEYLKRTRDIILKVIEKTEPKIHVHGHHHYFYSKKILGTKVYGLDMDDSRFDKNAMRFDLLDLED